MPSGFDNLEKLSKTFVSPTKSAPSNRELIYENQTISNLTYGTPEERLAQAKAKQSAPPPLLSGKDLKATLAELVNLPGATVNVTPTQIQSTDFFLDRIQSRPVETRAPFGVKPVVNTRDAYAQNLGKSLIVENLAKSIEELEAVGINDDNIKTLNDIQKEIKGYADLATDYSDLMNNIIISNSTKLAEAPIISFTDFGKKLQKEIDEASQNKVDKSHIASIFSGINNKILEIKSPYLGKKFMETQQVSPINVPFKNNAAADFNKLFDPNKSWKDFDSFKKDMVLFAYDNTSPGELAYSLKKSDMAVLLQKLEQDPDSVSDGERAFLKSLEETTLRGVANYLNKELETVTDEGTAETYQTALKNINQRVTNGNKTYDIISYPKALRSWNIFKLKGSEAFGSLAARISPYDDSPTAEHLGKSILYGPVPVDLGNDGKMDVDKYGNLILSNQFTYVKKDGSLGYNAGAIPELSSAVIGQMAPIIAIDLLTRGGGKLLAKSAQAAGVLGVAGRAASAVGARWEAINAWNGLRIADRISTFGLVTGSVYGSMYQDELRWTKDTEEASKRAWGRSVIEGLTEAIGAPEIGMFTAGRFTQSAGRQLLTMFTPRGATISQKLGNFILNAGRVGRLAATQSITESLEEEMSLYGNYLFGKMIKAEDKDYGKEDTFEGMDVAQTFLDSLVGMAPYSLLGVSIQQATSRNKLGPEHETLWNMANDPEYYRAKIKDLVDKKKFTTEQAAQALQVVAEARGVLESIPDFKNIKDLRTLLSDHDAQKKYFHDVLYKKKLQGINYDELTDEQKKALKNARIGNLLDEKGRRELNKLSKKKELTEEENKRKTELEAFKNATFISGYQFTEADKKKLVQLGILKQEELENSPEDLLAELETVDKKILKKRERIDQFLNMTDAEKEKTVAKVFQEHIESLETSDNPATLATQLERTKKQLEFITKMPPKYKAEYAGRQALIEALETKLGELVAVNPQTGRNKITEEFLADSTEELTHWELQQKKEKLEENKQFINETDYAELQKKYSIPINLNVLAFNQMSAEEQEIFLVDYLKQIKDTLPDPVFELETLESLFTLIDPETQEVIMQPNISEEMFESVRNKVFEVAAEEKKKEMQPEVVETAEEEQEVSEEDSSFSNEEEGLLTAAKQTDETGKTDTVNVEELFHKLNKSKSKKSTLSKEAFANKLIGKIQKSLEKKGIELDLKFFNQLTDFVKKGVGGKYNSAQILSKGKQLLDNSPKGVEELISGIIDQVEFASKFYKVNPNRRSLVTGKPFTSKKGEESTEEGFDESEESEEFEGFLEEDEETEETLTLPNKLQQKANADSVEKEKELTLRQNAVIQLQIPSSTYGFEVTKENKLSKDPAIQRNADILRLLVKGDYSTFKVRVTSRLNFLQQLAEAQGLNFQDFMDLLNKAHKEYTKAKGSASKKAESIAPLLKELNDFFGEDFFEQTFESSRDTPELIYMVEKNGSNLSDPVLTIVNAEGNIQDFDGYPFYTNIDSNPRILSKEDTKRLSYVEDILGDRVSELQQFVPVAEAVVKLANTIKKNPTHSEDFPISRITQGTHITATEKLVTLEESGLEVTKENIKVVENPKQKLGQETVAGVPGQVFLVINDSPVILSNEKVIPAEAEALAAMVFDKTLREKFFPGDDAQEEAEKLKKHIEKVFNIYEKQGRKVAFVYDKETEELVPFIPGVSGKQLTQEELTALFKLLFYNVLKKELSSVVPRFSMQEGEVVKVADQSYIDFIKSTHKVYMTDDGPGVRRNQRIIFDMGVAVAKKETKKETKLQLPKDKPASKSETTPKGKLTLASIKKTKKESKEPKETTDAETQAALDILENKKALEASEAATTLKETILANSKQAELVEEFDEDGNEVRSYYLINGVEYTRVSQKLDEFKGDKKAFGTKRALKTGKEIDKILREVFGGRNPVKPDSMSDAAFTKLVNQAKNIYEALNKNYIIITDEIIVWDETSRVAGALDMLLIDRETGEPQIVDFKSSAHNFEFNGRIKGFGDVFRAETPDTGNLKQQNVYGILFSGQYDVVPGLNLMYIGVSYKNKTTNDVTGLSILSEKGEPIIPIETDPSLVAYALQPFVEARPATKLVAKEETLAPDAETKKSLKEIPRESISFFVSGGSGVDHQSFPSNKSTRDYDIDTKKLTGFRYVEHSDGTISFHIPYNGLDIRRGSHLGIAIKGLKLEQIDEKSIKQTMDRLGDALSKIPKDVTGDKRFKEIERIGNEIIDAELTALEEAKPTEVKTTIQMQPANVAKIKAGTKTTTTRSESQAKQINIPVGESAIVNFGGQDFKVTNRGLLSIEEAGGKEAILKSEGVASETEFSYPQTKTWFKGKGKLYVYDIVPLETTPTKVKPEVQELSEEEKQNYNPLINSITVNQVEQGQKNKIDCATENTSAKKTNKVGFAQNRKDA